jgi:signal transduction histidine kinase
MQLAQVGGSQDEVGELASAFQTMATNVSRAQQAERDLVANVSHELKTPLTSIQGFSQAMLDGTVSGEQDYQELALIIQQESQRMRRLVEQMLELSRLEAGTTPLDLGPVALDEFVEQIGKRYARLGEAKGVSVEWRAPAGLTLNADAGRLEQVLVNLLDNALQYTDTGGRISLFAQYAQPSGISFVVRDTGKGIPAADVPRLFERFYQVERSRAGQGRHVGLGLAIVREIVDAHHGRIAVESTEGVGTTVTVTIPQSGNGRVMHEPTRPAEAYAFGSRLAAPSQ